MEKKKIVILGCENSHADVFLGLIRDQERYASLDVVGVYSDEPEASRKLADTFGVPILSAPDEAAGRVDGVIVTARHGKWHLPYALPYIQKRQVMFIDKPITVSEEDACRLAALFRENEIRFTGGSCCKFEENVVRLAETVKNTPPDQVFGGFVRCPVNLENEYGDFYFYSQHLIETVTTIFGIRPVAVQAFRNANVISVLFRYPDYDVVGEFVDDNYAYSAMISTAAGTENAHMSVGQRCFEAEFEDFFQVLNGKDATVSPEDFVAPVFILNAIDRSLKSGRLEQVGRV